MRSFEALGRQEERELVAAALESRQARARLRKLACDTASRIAALYQAKGTEISAARMTEVAMRQLDALLNEHGRRSRRQSAERFSFVFAWWSTRRIEQLLREPAKAGANPGTKRK